MPTDIPAGTELPPELQDIVDEMRANQNAKIEAIGKDVSKKRDEAVKGRRQSGIETIWAEDEEYYQGVDDANRDSHPWVKSASSSGGISRTPQKGTTRCSSFFNITRQFVDSASARMGDILLPAGDWNFAVKASPVQDDDTGGGTEQRPGLLPGLGGPGLLGQPDTLPGQVPLAVGDPAASQSGTGAPIQPPGSSPADTLAPGAPPPPQVQTPAEADSDPLQLAAERAAEKAELWIQDKLVECQYHTEVRKVIEDSARLGTGILKGPFPERKVLRKAMQRDGKFALELVSKTNPASKHIDPWDFFPDPDCGEDIHNGRYVLERDRLTAKELRNLKGTPGYLKDQIDMVLDEGPLKKNYSEGHRVADENTNDSDKFEVWYFYGLVDPVSLSAMSVKMTEEESAKNQLPAIVTLVNETPIKAAIDPLDTGEFPYDVMPWQRVAGTWTGVGVARQGRTAQDMLNAAGRAMMDNAGLSSGPMIIIRKGAILPADGNWQITARKVWWATEQADQGRSMSDAFTTVNIPMVQKELSAIIELAYKMMEDSTGITFLLQGQQGSAPDTVGGMELLHRNASAMLRRLARVFDERVTEPHIRRYYEWLLMHGPDEAKGDMNIEAIGSTALVEREIQAMEAMALLQMSLNPAYGLDPEKAMAEVLKTKRFIVDKWTMDPQKKANLPPPVIPAIEVAKIRSADLDKQLALQKDVEIASNTLLKHKVDVTENREDIYAQTRAQEMQTNVEARIQEIQTKRELAMLDYANRRNISLDQIKAELAQTSMKLRTQALLSQNGTEPSRPVMEPPVQTPGRAPDGFAFEQ